MICCIKNCDDTISSIRGEDLAEFLETILLGYEAEDNIISFIDYIKYGEEDKMNKDNLKAGYVVRVRNGEYGLVMETLWDTIISFNDNTWCPLKYDLTCEYNQEYDVVEVYNFTTWECLTRCTDVEKSNRKLLWKRVETKSMTLKEIEAKLGYKIKIVPDPLVDNEPF